MSASYINRDPLVNQQSTLQKLSTRTGSAADRNEYLHMSLSTHSNIRRPYGDRATVDKSCSPSQTQVSLQSPKMSPDSTLTHLPLTCTNSLFRFPQTSPGICASSSGSSTCESFLRSVLTTDLSDRTVCVGSSTGVLPPAAHMTSPQVKTDPNRASAQLSPVSRPRALTNSNISRACTPNDINTSNNSHNLLHSSASVPSSTTPVKKSSRRNPWGSETYSDLITVAIHSYPEHQATLQQIYDFIITHYEYFRERSDPTASAGWKNSIRHNLSLHDRFTKCPKSSDNTKSSYWRINTEVASKPYVRRRACSIDASNLKRPGGCGKAGGGGGRGGNRSTRHTTSQSDKLSATTTTRLSGLTTSIPLSSLCEIQLYTSGVDSTVPANTSQSHAAVRSSPKICQPGAKTPGYFPYPSPNTMGSETEMLMHPCNGTRWSHPKPSPPSRTGYANTPTASQYHQYDQLSGNLLLDSPEFHSMVGSTDHALARNRASSLIEHLLRSDHAAINIPLESHNAAPTHLSQSYLPNAFLTPHPMSSSTMSHAIGGNRGFPMTDQSGYSAFLPPTTPHPVDTKSLSMQLSRPMTPEAPVDNPAHHLRPVHVQTITDTHALPSGGLAFNSSWQSYASQFPMTMGAVPAVSSFNGVSNFVNSDISSSVALRLGGAKPGYNATIAPNVSVCSPHHTTRPLPFLSNTTTQHSTAARLSPPTNSSTNSSIRSWRHTLGLDAFLNAFDQSVPPHSTDNATLVSSSQSTLLEHRCSLGSITPPNSLYYSSPIRHTLSNVFHNTDCALDTPPYQQVKPEPPDDTGEVLVEPRDSRANSTMLPPVTPNVVVGGDGATCSAFTYPCTVYSQAHPPHDLSTSAISRFVGGEFAYDEDDDDDDTRDKLELELSLELADRIVASTRSTQPK